MVLQLYNTLSKKKEVFTPIDEGKVKMYCCGPTVYNFAHIGNLRAYLFNDSLRRILEYNDFNVEHVVNITDVGHLTDDGDEGEDKLEKGAKREGKSVLDISQFYTDAFISDLADLNITSPTVFPKATEHINEMIEVIRQLEANGFTYQANGNVYFDTSKFPYYCDLGRLNLDEMRSTDRVDEDEGKKHKADFVLWFTKSKFENHSLKWQSPWGEGYPGWHIECTAMSSKYLGNHFDIHCGGVDHIQIHHTNEIAQAEGAFGEHPWVNYWLHNEFLILNNGKMSKSGDSFITLKTLKDKGFSPDVYRFFCMNAHHRKQISFTYEGLENSKSELSSLRKKIVGIKKELSMQTSKSLSVEISHEESDKFVELKKKFLEAINDDLNVPRGLGILNEVLKSDLTAGEKLFLAYDFDSVFGLSMNEWIEEDKSLSSEEKAELQVLLDNRTKAREEKNWDESDSIRNKIQSLGYVLHDTPEGQVVEKA